MDDSNSFLEPATLFVQYRLRNVVKKIRKRERLRDNAAHEMLTSEQSYVATLEEMVSLYLTPLRDAAETSSKIISKKAIGKIFGNSEEIISIGHEMIKMLEDRLQSWDKDHSIADAFLYLVPHLTAYSDYCANYATALICLNKHSAHEKFAQFLEKVAPLGQHAKLPDYLILPVQRVPRYKLLLQTLLTNTWKMDPEYEQIQRSIDAMGELADTINRAIREKQELEEVIAIQHKFKNAAPIVAKNRAFIKEGPLLKICRKSPKMRYFFLFTDCLVYARKIDAAIGTMYMYHRMVSLLRGSVESVPDKKRAVNAFQVRAKEKSFTLCCEDPEEKKEWMEAIQKVIDNLGGADTTNVAPVWVPDEESGCCMSCGVKFTVVNRRHHCRRCGKIVCGKCSSAEFMLINLRQLARVCNQCFDALVEMNGGWAVMQSRTNLYRAPKAMLAQSRITIPADQWSETNIREWVESVAEGKFAPMKDTFLIPQTGMAFVQLSQKDIIDIVKEADFGPDANVEELAKAFFEELEELKRRMYDTPKPQVTIIPTSASDSHLSRRRKDSKAQVVQQDLPMTSPGRRDSKPQAVQIERNPGTPVNSPRAPGTGGPPSRVAPIAPRRAAPVASDSDSSGDSDSSSGEEEERKDATETQTNPPAKPSRPVMKRRLPANPATLSTSSPSRMAEFAPAYSRSCATLTPRESISSRSADVTPGKPQRHVTPSGPPPAVPTTRPVTPRRVVPREAPPTTPPPKYATARLHRPAGPPPTRAPTNQRLQAGRATAPSSMVNSQQASPAPVSPRKNEEPLKLNSSNPFFEDFNDAAEEKKLPSPKKEPEPIPSPKKEPEPIPSPKTGNKKSTNPFDDDDDDPQEIIRPQEASKPSPPKPASQEISKQSPKPTSARPLPRPNPVVSKPPQPQKGCPVKAQPQPQPQPQPRPQPQPHPQPPVKKSTNPFDDDDDDENPFAVEPPKNEPAKKPLPQPQPSKPLPKPLPKPESKPLPEINQSPDPFAQENPFEVDDSSSPNGVDNNNGDPFASFLNNNQPTKHAEVAKDVPPPRPKKPSTNPFDDDDDDSDPFASVPPPRPPKPSQQQSDVPPPRPPKPRY